MTAHRRSRTRQSSGPQDGRPVWNAERIQALGVSTDLATAAQIFRLSLATAYRLVKRDAFPVPVIRAGTHYRVPVAPILTTLGLQPTPERPPNNPPAPTPDTDSPDRPDARPA